MDKETDRRTEFPLVEYKEFFWKVSVPIFPLDAVCNLHNIRRRCIREVGAMHLVHLLTWCKWEIYQGGDRIRDEMRMTKCIMFFLGQQEKRTICLGM